MARIDVHCPSRIVPADYEFVGITTAAAAHLSYVPEVRNQNARIAAHMAATGGRYAGHEHGGNCMSCGAHCVYMAAFFHRPSGEYIATGMDCAEKLGIGDVNRFRKFRDIIDAARHHRAGKRKAEGLLTGAGLMEVWRTWLVLRDLPAAARHYGFQPDTPADILADYCEDNQLDQQFLLRALTAPARIPSKDEGVLLNIVDKGVKYGRFSSAQLGFLKVLQDRLAGRKPEEPKPNGTVVVLARHAAQAAAVPVAVADAEGVRGILELFKAGAQHLKFPKVRVAVRTAAGDLKAYRLSPAGAKSKNAGCIYVVDEDGEDAEGKRPYRGKITPAGEWRPVGDHQPGLTESLKALAKDPAGEAARYGRLLGRCCFCGKHLEDERSTAMGYGPVCAQHYHLPWGDTRTQFQAAPVATPAPALPAPVPAPAPVVVPAAPALPDFPEIGTETLTYKGEHKTFYGEVSSLEGFGNTWPSRFGLRSAKTGSVKEFVKGAVAKDIDGDVTWVEYKADDLKVRIFND